MLNIHSKFSIKYGVKSPQKIIDILLELGYNHALITDINNTSATLSFVKYAKQLKLPVTVGVDFRIKNNSKYILIAKNNKGYQEINYILTDFLKTDCKEIKSPPFSNNYTVVYPLGKEPQKLNKNEWVGVNLSHLNKLEFIKANSLRNKMVIQQTMTFSSKKDYNTHRLLRAIDNNCLLSKLDKTEEGLETDRFLSKKTLIDAFKEYPQIIKNTENIIKNSFIDYDIGESTIPKNITAYTNSITNDYEKVKKLCYDGIAYRYGKTSQQIEDRIEKELDIITEKHYLSYFLIAWDLTSFARSKNFFYVGRGSGANSIIAYLLRITNVDPLELDLYFERFINLYRKNPPDFDLDFSWRDRDEITKYLFEKYDNVALLCTYNTFQQKATIRELGKVFGLPKHEIDKLSTLNTGQEIDQMAQLVLKYSKLISGLPNHLSIHAGGIIISEKPIQNYSATFIPPKGYPTTQFSMLEAEDVGHYKFDILSQRGLGKIKDCLETIKENQPNNPPLDIEDIKPLKNDKKVLSLLRNATAMGCFYVESPAMRMLMTKLQTRSYLELVAASSIIRPGVAKSGMMREYILRHKDPERRKKAHPTLLTLMPDTYGIMVYQEDVIKVAHHFAGLTISEADILRRGMSGKFRSRQEFQDVKEKFFYNCINKQKYSQELTIEIWNQIESFAGYAFAKGHSASYAIESFQSLYLKAYYPLEYMLATINNFGGFYKTEFYVIEAKLHGAKIQEPCINNGSWQSTIKNKTITLGFNQVNTIDKENIKLILQNKIEHGKYNSLHNLLERTQIQLKQLILLIRIGALRTIESNKKILMWDAYIYFNPNQSSPTQTMLFSEKNESYNLPNIQPLKYENEFEQLEYLDFLLTSPFKLTAQTIPTHTTTSQFKKHIGLEIQTYGYLITLKKTRTQKKDYMYFATFMDIKDQIFDVTIFPEQAKRFKNHGSGIYKIVGVIASEYTFLSIEAKYLTKYHYRMDARYDDVKYHNKPDHFIQQPH